MVEAEALERSKLLSIIVACQPKRRLHADDDNRRSQFLQASTLVSLEPEPGQVYLVKFHKVRRLSLSLLPHATRLGSLSIIHQPSQAKLATPH